MIDATDSEPAEAADIFDLVFNRERAEASWPVYEARLLRLMGRYQDAMNDKLRRIRELVNDQVSGQLTSMGT